MKIWKSHLKYVRNNNILFIYLIGKLNLKEVSLPTECDGMRCDANRESLEFECNEKCLIMYECRMQILNI